LEDEVLGRVEVIPGAANMFEVAANPALTGVGLPVTLTVTALDACGNRAANFVTTTAINITSNAATPANLTNTPYYFGLTLTNPGEARIDANTAFDAQGQYIVPGLQLGSRHGTLHGQRRGFCRTPPSAVQWVAPTCTFPDGLQIWVSRTNSRCWCSVTTARRAPTSSAWAWQKLGRRLVRRRCCGRATPGPVPAADRNYLTVNGHHCPDPECYVGGSIPEPGIPFVDGLEVTINTTACNDRGSPGPALTRDATQGIFNSVVVNTGDGDDTIIPCPSRSAFAGLTGGRGNDTLDYRELMDALGDSGGGAGTEGIVFDTPAWPAGPTAPSASRSKPRFSWLSKPSMARIPMTPSAPPTA